MNNITFNGRFISSANVLKKSKNGQFLPHKVSFVELNTSNKNDILALKNLQETWKGAKTSNIIYETAQDVYDTKENQKFFRFFVLTNQKKGFAKLNPKDILITSQFFFVPKEKQVELMFQQANPRHKFDSQLKQYKHIGTGFMDAIKKLFSHKDIVLATTPESKGFYLKNDFKLLDEKSCDAIFTRNK